MNDDSVLRAFHSALDTIKPLKQEPVDPKPEPPSIVLYRAYSAPYGGVATQSSPWFWSLEMALAGMKIIAKQRKCRMELKYMVVTAKDLAITVSDLSFRLPAMQGPSWFCDPGKDPQEIK